MPRAIPFSLALVLVGGTLLKPSSRRGDANEEDLLHVQGLSIWPKGRLAEIEAENQKWKGVSIPEVGATCSSRFYFCLQRRCIDAVP